MQQSHENILFKFAPFHSPIASNIKIDTQYEF